MFAFGIRKQVKTRFRYQRIRERPLLGGAKIRQAK